MFKVYFARLLSSKCDQLSTFPVFMCMKVNHLHILLKLCTWQGVQNCKFLQNMIWSNQWAIYKVFFLTIYNWKFVGIKSIYSPPYRAICQYIALHRGLYIDFRTSNSLYYIDEKKTLYIALQSGVYICIYIYR